MSMPDNQPVTWSHVGQWAGWAKIAGVMALGLLAQTAYLGWIARDWASRIEAVESGIGGIREEQDEAKSRADLRQREIESQVREAVTTDRERANSLDARIRPLETQAAATAATLQSIQTSLQAISSDLRDIRRDIKGNEK